MSIVSAKWLILLAERSAVSDQWSPISLQAAAIDIGKPVFSTRADRWKRKALLLPPESNQLSTQPTRIVR